jgi:hypothetical protein
MADGQIPHDRLVREFKTGFEIVDYTCERLRGSGTEREQRRLDGKLSLLSLPPSIPLARSDRTGPTEQKVASLFACKSTFLSAQKNNWS